MLGDNLSIIEFLSDETNIVGLDLTKFSKTDLLYKTNPQIQTFSTRPNITDFLMLFSETTPESEIDEILQGLEESVIPEFNLTIWGYAQKNWIRYSVELTFTQSEKLREEANMKNKEV